jgi:hypothetical protein
VKLRSVGFDWVPGQAGQKVDLPLTGDQTAMLAQLEHGRWMTAKGLANWTPGESTDFERKTHSCMKTWDELSPEEQHKDTLQIETIARALDAAGYGVKRIATERPV